MGPRARFLRPGARYRVVRTRVDHGRQLLGGEFARERAERPPRQGDGRRPDAMAGDQAAAARRARAHRVLLDARALVLLLDLSETLILRLSPERRSYAGHERHEKRERHETE